MHGCHYIHNACDGIAIVIVTIHVTESLGYGITCGDMAGWILQGCTLKSQVVSLQTAHSWANAGVVLGDACIGSGVAFEAIKLLG